MATLPTLHASAKTAVPSGAGILISVDNGSGGRTFDELTPAALIGTLRGAWAANTAYAIRDVVTYQGSSYAALAAFTSSSTFVGGNWQLLAQAGATGATGATGASGTGTGTVNTGATGQLAGYLSGGTTLSGVTLGSGLSLNGSTLSATATGSTSALTVTTIDGSTIPASSGSPYQMLTGDRVIYVNKTTGAATSITLPASPTIGVTYDIKDGKGDAQTNPITITAPNSGTIDGAATLVISSNRSARSLKAVTATVWIVL